jgi:hypothetical protein
MVELSLFFIAIPREVFYQIYISAKGDVRDGANDKFIGFMAVCINAWFFVSSFVSKADLYTDVTFALEASS